MIRSLVDVTLPAIAGYRGYELRARQDSDSTPFTLFSNSGAILGLLPQCRHQPAAAVRGRIDLSLALGMPGAA